MKIRAGFVSNSSSSSFLIQLYDWENTKEDVKKYVYKIIKNRAKKIIKNATNQSTKDYFSQYLNDEFLDQNILIDDIKNQIDKLKYWYSPRILNRNNTVIMDLNDNFLTDEDAKKIIKKYYLSVYDYWTHMG